MRPPLAIISISLLTLLLFLYPNRAAAQVELGVKGGGTLSWITPGQRGLSIGTTIPWPGVELGGTAQWNFHRHFFVMGELGYQRIRSRLRTEGYVIDSSGQLTGELFHDNYGVSYHSVNLPILLGFRGSFYQVYAGVQPSLRFGGYMRHWANGTINGIDANYDERYSRNMGVPFSLGIRVGVSTRITQKLSIDASYTRGLNSVFSDESANLPWYANIVTYGVRYSLRSL